MHGVEQKNNRAPKKCEEAGFRTGKKDEDGGLAPEKGALGKKTLTPAVSQRPAELEFDKFPKVRTLSRTLSQPTSSGAAD